MVKVMIADDQELMRDSLNILLSSKSELQIVGLMKDGNEVLEKIDTLMPDVILMDIRMPRMDGVVCTKLVKEKYPQIKVIILTTFDDDEYIFDALKYGASGYLLKGISLDELVNGINSVVQGGGIIHPNVASKALKMFSNMARSEMKSETMNEGVKELSKNEWLIIQKIKEGLSNREISEELCFSEGTIRNYISVILDKLSLRDRTQLAIWGVQNERLVSKQIAEE